MAWPRAGYGSDVKSTNDLKREIEQWRERRAARLSGASLRISGSRLSRRWTRQREPNSTSCSSSPTPSPWTLGRWSGRLQSRSATAPFVPECRDAPERDSWARNGMRRWPTWGKTILFAGAKRHAETLAALPDEHFADWKRHPATRYADFLVSDVGGGPVPDATAIIKRFQGKRSFRRSWSESTCSTPASTAPEVVSLVTGTVHDKHDPLPADARSRSPQGPAHRQGRLHDLRLRGRNGVRPRGLRVVSEGDVGIAARLTSPRLSAASGKSHGQGRRQWRGSVA